MKGVCILISTFLLVNIISGQKLKTVWLDLGDDKKPVNIYRYKNSSDKIVMVNMHDDERTSIDAAHYVLSKQGGTLIRIDNRNQRFIRFRLKKVFYEFDGNRMFSEEGIRKSLEERGAVNEKAVEEVQEFAKKFLKLIPDDLYCLIALHNNTEGNYSINFYKPGGKYAGDAAAYKTQKKQDPDDFFFSTDSVFYARLAKAGYNSVLQDNANAIEDGSLSVYYGRKNKRYINCETQHGKFIQNVRMLKSVLQILKMI
jgi:hypothetical protein